MWFCRLHRQKLCHCSRTGSVQQGSKHSTDSSEAIQYDLKSSNGRRCFFFLKVRLWLVLNLGFDSQLLSPFSSTAYCHWIMCWCAVPDCTGLLSPLSIVSGESLTLQSALSRYKRDLQYLFVSLHHYSFFFFFNCISATTNGCASILTLSLFHVIWGHTEAPYIQTAASPLLWTQRTVCVCV